MSDQSNSQTRRTSLTPRTKTFLICAVIFLVACGVRLLHWQDTRHALVFEGMAGEYKSHADSLLDRGLVYFLRGPDPPSDANVVKHPPGYPLLVAAVYALFNHSDAALRLLHVLLDASAAVLVFFIAAGLFNFTVGALAGLLVALSPQLAYHSIALIPDSPAAPPILLAALLLLCASKRERAWPLVVAAGAVIGVSCWLRSNALLLAPFLAVVVVPFLFGRGRRLRMALALVGASLAVIAPVTVRNYVVFGRFIPLSLSAGITLVEGIGVYDREGRFKLPSTDYGVTKWEAEKYDRPDYLGSRFAPDGVERERGRVAAGLAVIRENPGWFFGVMLHRASSMLRLARVEVVSAGPAVTRPLALARQAQPDWALAPAEWVADNSVRQEGTELSLTDNGQRLRLTGDGQRDLLVSPPARVRASGDYLLRLPLKIRRGSVVVAVVDARRGDVLAETPVQHPVNWLELTPERQPAVNVQRPFVSGDAEEVRVVLRNGSKTGAQSVEAEAGRAELYDLGPSAQTWTRYTRLPLRLVQKLFLTATVLPLVLLGVALLARERRWSALAVLFAVPLYYMCVQSALWTEFRYILTLHYFLLIVAAFALQRAGAGAWGYLKVLRTRHS